MQVVDSRQLAEYEAAEKAAQAGEPGAESIVARGLVFVGLVSLVDPPR